MIENDNCNVTCKVKVTQGNALEEDIDEDDIESRPPSSHTYMSIIDLFNSICTLMWAIVNLSRSARLPDAHSVRIKAFISLSTITGLTGYGPHLIDICRCFSSSGA